MARIPKFQQQKLASSLVGTPGIDTSTQRSAQAISQTAGSAANVFGQLAAKRQKAKDDALTNKSLIDLDLTQEQLLRDHQTENAEFRGDPRERVKGFQDKSRKLFQEAVDAIPSRNAKQQFSILGERVLGAKLGREAKEASENQGILAFNDTVDSVNQLALEAGQLGLDSSLSLEEKGNRLLTLVQMGNETVRISQPILSVENHRILKKDTPEAILRGLISTTVTNNPQELLVLLKDENVKKQFSPEELAKFNNDAIKNLKTGEQRRELDQLFSSFDGATELLDRFKKKDPTLLAQLENAEPSAFTEAFKEYIINKPVDPATKAVKQAELLDALSELHVKKKKNKRKTMGGTLEEAMSFMVKATEAAQDGDITEAQYTTHLTAVTGPFLDKVKKENTGLGLSSLVDLIPPVQSYNMVKDWFTRNGIDNKETLVSVMDDFDSILKQQGPVTRASVSKATASALRNHMIRRDPRLGLLEGTPNVVIKEDRDILQGIPGDDTPPVAGQTTAGESVTVKTGTLNDGTGRRVRVTFENGVETKRELI